MENSQHKKCSFFFFFANGKWLILLLKVKVPDLGLVNIFRVGEKVKVPNPALVNISPILAMANG